MDKFNRLLITGAAGMLGGVMRRELVDLADKLRINDRADTGDAAAYEEKFICDLSDRDAALELTKDVDAVVHMAGISKEGSFDDILQSNIVGLYNLYEGCRKNGVKRVAWASSLHTIGFHSTARVLGTDAKLRPDSNYGVSKVFGEAVAQYYWDKYRLESVSVRIYSSFPEPSDRRQLSTWLSHRDCANLFRRALLAPVVRHTIVYGVSDNTVKLADNTNAAHLGWKPLDSSEPYREKVEAATPKPSSDDLFIACHGGSFASAGHFED